MSIHFIAFLVGLFGVPVVLLAMAHRLRRRSPRVRPIFWGAIVGHCVAAAVAVVWGMIPPDAWEASETARGFAGFWSLLVFPVAGAMLMALVSRRKNDLSRR
jgi:quinol-cytochrome oxidoreductase complex cytochrome b subunit